MGKKFISLVTNGSRYRLYSDDIRTVFQKAGRKCPPPPQFPPAHHLMPDAGHDRVRGGSLMAAAPNSS
jgi:hypothetical protein